MTTHIRVRVTQGGIGYVVTADEIPGYTAEGRTHADAIENYRRGLAAVRGINRDDVVITEVNL